MTPEPEDGAPARRKRPLRPARGANGVPATGGNFAALRQFFQDQQWTFEEADGQSVLRLGCAGDNGEWTCYARIEDNPGRFLFYSVLSAKAPDARRAVMSEFLTRVNCGLVLGNFEMDFSDGEIRYRTSAPLEGEEPSQGFFHTMVYTNLLMTDRYFPAIMSVIYAGMSAEQAIAHVGD